MEKNMCDLKNVAFEKLRDQAFKRMLNEKETT